MKKVTKILLILLLSIYGASSAFALSYAQAFMNENFAYKQNSASLKQCNEKLAVIESIEIRQAREKHIAEITSLNQKYISDLNDRVQIIFQLTEVMKIVPEKQECKQLDARDYSPDGVFLAKLAIQQSRAQSETRSAQTILYGNNFFRQYLLMNFDEFKTLVLSHDENQILAFILNKADAFIKLASD